jgi:hypothetical protein
MRRLWIADLYVSDATRQKLVHVHRLDPDDVRAGLVCRTGLRYAWHEHPERGRRVLVELFVGSARVLAVLYPAGDPEEETWHLGSAYRVWRPDRRRGTLAS